jgi:hypothetical protein
VPAAGVLAVGPVVFVVCCASELAAIHAVSKKRRGRFEYFELVGFMSILIRRIVAILYEGNPKGGVK